MMMEVAMRIGSLSAVGSMAIAPGAGLEQGTAVSGMAFFCGTSLPSLERSTLRAKGRFRMFRMVSANWKGSECAQNSRSIATGAVFSLMPWLLANAGAAQALTKDDVDEAYTKVELFTKQVSTTASSVFETSKNLFDQVFKTVKPGFDLAAPYVQQTTESVTKFAGPLASDLAEEAQRALKVAGVDTEPGVEFAKNAALQTSKVLEGAQPLGLSVYQSALAADPLFLLEAAGGLILFYFLAPGLVSAIASSARGYAGNLAAAQALDFLLNKDYALIDIRTEKEKSRSGIPSLPSNAKSKYVAVPLEELPAKVKSQVRNFRNVEAEVAAIKISFLKRLRKGSKIVILDESGDIAKVVARVLNKLGFKSSYVVNDGFKGGRGWIQSRLGIEDYSSSSSVSFSEVLSPSRIIPASTKRFGTSASSRPRLNLLPGGIVED